MADSNQSRRTEFADNDPFAELSRIMGLDPNQPLSSEESESFEDPKAAAHPVVDNGANDFDIDLEKELLGELDFSEFDEVGTAAPEPVVDWRSVARQDTAQHASQQDWRASAPVETVVPVADASVEPLAAFEDHFEVDHSVEDLAASLMEENLADAMDVPSFDVIEPRSFSAAPAPMISDPVEDFDDNSHGEFVETPAHAIAEAPNSPVIDTEIDFDLLDAEFARMDPGAESESAVAAYPEGDDFLDVEPVSPDAGGQYAVAHDLDPVQADHDEPVAGSAFDAAFEPIASESQSLSLEDELNALLAASDASEASTPEADWNEAQGDQEPAVSMPVAAAAWKPAVATFGRANFPPVAGSTQRWEPAREDVPVAAAKHMAMNETEMPESAPQTAHAAFEPVSHAKAAPAMLVVDDFADVFGEPQQEVKAPVHLASASQPAYAAHSQVPDIETVEMTEAAFHVTDDLDLPELDYATDQPARAYDDLDDEFAQAFDDLVSESDFAPATSATTPAWAAAAPAAMPAATPMQEPHGTDSYSLGDGNWDTGAPTYPSELDYDTELEQAIAMASYEEEAGQPQQRRNRGVLIAAMVAGVAVIGGAGVFGMSMFGGGSDTPAIVRADTDPMKVRPENPGGTTVPNQDSEAYARVSGDRPAGAPAQETLITTAEEPVDITADPTTAGLAPGISEEGEESMLAPLPEEDGMLADGQPKGEDRLIATDESVVAPIPEEVAAVAPRRVRTMVVRPDGTMVPREEATPAAPATVVAAAPLGTASTLAPADAAPAAEVDIGPSVDTPATVGVVPSQRTEPAGTSQAVQAPAAAQPAPVVQASAPAAAAPLAAAASEWSMQIASQPTAEGAQSTYQDLARRYGSVLEGRGVNIVKADIAGKGTYYRVRIPSASRDEAINLCTRYKAAGGSCFVSR